MMSRWVFVLALVLLVGCAANVWADSTSVVQVGVTVRTRIETTDNATYLQTEMQKGSSYYRNRSSLSVTAFPASRWELGARLTNEFRYYFVPETHDFKIDEIVVDQLYARWDSIGGRAVSAIIGRQNISLGEGFLVQDGAGLDGSRTAYFNAVNAAWAFRPGSEVRLIYLYQQTFDSLLPIINNQDKRLSEQDESAVIAWLSSSVGRAKLQGYLIRKTNHGGGRFPQATIYCPGVRVQATISPSLTMTGEAAFQTGDWDTVSHEGFGGYAYAEISTGLPVYYPKSFTIGYVYLNGDDYRTLGHEGWDPMFGRWPKWSESYVYTLSREQGAGYWSNFSSVFAKTTVPFSPDLSLQVEYHYLGAPQRSDPDSWVFQELPGNPPGNWFGLYLFPGGRGHHRGDLVIAKLNYQLKPRITGHLLYELFDPGDFYFRTADRSAWVRMEAMLTF